MICDEPLNNGKETVCIRFKGSESINKASRQRKDHHIHTVPGQSVHKDCRLVYCNSNKIAQAGRHDLQDTQSTRGRQVRSTGRDFSFNEACLFCGTVVSFSSRKVEGESYHATMKSIMHTLLDNSTRRRDEWADEVRARMLVAHDLPAADAVYHQTCSTNFRTGKRAPLMFRQNEDDASQKRQKVGRPMKPNETGRLTRSHIFFEKTITNKQPSQI